MIYAFIGCYQDIWQVNPMGNGKTMAMSYYGYQDHKKGRKIVSNYFTSFSEQMTVEEMVTLFDTTDLQNITLLIDEIHVIFDSLGHKQGKTRLITNMITQTRKRKVDLYYTCQRWMSVNKRLRDMTTCVFLPYKIHLGTAQECNIDHCEQPHEIVITCQYPFKPWPLKVLNAREVGKLYDSNQIIREKY